MGSVTFDPVIQTPVNTIYYHSFVHDCVIICFPASDLNEALSRHFFLFMLLHWYILCTSCQKFAFFRKFNKTPSPLLSDSSLMLGIVKPGTCQGWAAHFTLTYKSAVSLFISTTLVLISLLHALFCCFSICVYFFAYLEGGYHVLMPRSA